MVRIPAPQKETNVRVLRIFMDPSDPLDDNQVSRLKDEILSKVDSMDSGSEIVLTRIKGLYPPDTTNQEEINIEKPDATSPLPPPGSVGCQLNHEREECEKAEEEAKEKLRVFKKNLSSSLDSLLSSEKMEWSPLVEVLGLHENNECDSSCHLWIVSDMLQHSPFLSFYKEAVPSFKDISGRLRHASKSVYSNITIWQIERCQSKGGEIQVEQKNQLRDFWNTYFDQVADRKFDKWESLLLNIASCY